MNKMNKKGFTLIEMLVVIAIIAVLVSIIIPTVTSATTKAAGAANAANLRSYKAELVTTYLSDPASVTISGTSVTFTPSSTIEYKSCGYTLDPTSTTLTATYDSTTNSFKVFFGDTTHDIAYYAKIAETGKAPNAS